MPKSPLAYRGTVSYAHAGGQRAVFESKDWEVVNPHGGDDCHTHMAVELSVGSLVPGHAPVNFKKGQVYEFDFNLERKYTVVLVS